MKHSIRYFSKGICLVWLSLLVLLTAGCNAGVQGAAGTVPADNGVTQDDAKQIALTDAGVQSDRATFVEIKTTQEHGGVQIYDLRFYTSEAEYEYEIKVSDGAIYSRDIDYLDDRESPKHDAAAPDGPAAPENAGVTVAQALQIALADAGVEQADATVVENKLDYEDGRQVYDLKFYTANAEYEYEISTSDGSVFRKNIEHYHTVNDGQQTNGASVDLETAKSIAVSHAGVDKDKATFKKAAKEYDDGVEAYEIEFYAAGSEYDYKIRCSDGKILEYEKD